jgi:hypothetical protein
LESSDGRRIEVYANREPKPAGGKGRPALDWMLDGESSADLIAVADLSTDRVWLFRREEAFNIHPGAAASSLGQTPSGDGYGSRTDEI